VIPTVLLLSPNNTHPVETGGANLGD